MRGSGEGNLGVCRVSPDFCPAPFFETGDARYAWLNNIVAVTKSQTGDGGPIHRVFAVK